MLEVNDSNFSAQVLNAEKPVLVDFWAPWCGPCKALAPTMEKVAEEYQDKIVVAKLNVDESPATAGQYAIMSIPTLLLFKQGKVVEQLVGLVPKEKIKDRLNLHI